MSEKINLDFTSITELDERIYISGKLCATQLCESKKVIFPAIIYEINDNGSLFYFISIADRCSEGYHINITDEKCLTCPKEETSYGTGLTKICADFKTMVQFCGSTVCSAYCPKVSTSTPYGDFTWPATLVSTTPQELACLYDDSELGPYSRLTIFIAKNNLKFLVC